MGGMIPAIEQGYVQREIQDAAYATQRTIESGEYELVGVNIHRVEDEPVPETLRIDPALEAEQVARLRDLKSRRGRSDVTRAIDALKSGAEGDANLMPLILEAVEARCTLGEVSDALRSVFGLHQEVVIL